MRTTALLALMALLLPAGQTLACSCESPPAPDKALKLAEAVFLGKAVDVKVENGTRIATFKIKRTWKGTKGDTVTVLTSVSGESCGYLFKEGEQYLVYCYRETKSKSLRTSICHRTTTKQDAKQDVKVIGKGKKPPKD